MSQVKSPEIFVSYAWEPDSEKIVDKFETTCKTRGLKLVRDKTDLQFKGIISNFMKTLGRGRYILVVLSEQYLKSHNCMIELSEIVKNGNFYDRIFPIVTASTNIFKPIGRIGYIKYWEDQITELNEAMKLLNSQADLQGIREDIDFYTEVRATISNLTSTLKDMNSLSVQQHVTANFEEIFSLIDKDLASDDDADSELPIEVLAETNEKPVKEERVSTNLMKVNFPPSIYVAQIAFNREDVIKQSWESEYKLKMKSGERKVAFHLLLSTGLPFRKEFTVSNHKMISFQDPSDRNNGLQNIIEVGSVEKYSIGDFLSIREENSSTLIELLNVCLKQLLIRKDIEWVKDESCFRFRVGVIAKAKKLTWKGIKTATRTVIFEKFNKEKTQITSFKHLAFKADFVALTSGIYLAINPTWSVTRDGKFASNFAADEISGQKRLENNQAVFNHCRFLQYCLINSITDNDHYDIITVDQIEDFEIV